MAEGSRSWDFPGGGETYMKSYGLVLSVRLFEYIVV